MWKELKFALYAIKKNIQSSAELRTSFLMTIVGMIINNSSFLILWIFFVKSVGKIGGWEAFDVVALQGFVNLCYGIVFSAGLGIRNIAEYVSLGTFDRFMLSPKNLLVRVATSSFGVFALGDCVFGVTCLTVYAVLIHASAYQILLIILSVIISTIVFLSTVIAIYSLSFFFADANSITSGFLELFLTPAIFHGGAFQGILRFFFTFAIPSLLIGALPVEIVKNMSLEKLLLISILGLLWFVFSIKIFNQAVKKYESSNFMTFGG